jgi:hypothetical protein
MISIDAETLREYLKDPQSGSAEYGKWGALNMEQRQFLRIFADKMDVYEHEIERLRAKLTKMDGPE